eukprot:TRINITY_DN3218_c0_g1_i2.p1 TRINITY_DN3218_c0_g1~~TRINITY_DN3218_c0_g1_i2.p1  ORF type:complete len:746 (-),score=160.02 TRINITY_DN3218_c0_g1_i2:332-2569(-)
MASDSEVQELRDYFQDFDLGGICDAFVREGFDCVRRFGLITDAKVKELAVKYRWPAPYLNDLRKLRMSLAGLSSSKKAAVKTVPLSASFRRAKAGAAAQGLAKPPARVATPKAALTSRTASTSRTADRAASSRPVPTSHAAPTSRSTASRPAPRTPHAARRAGAAAPVAPSARRPLSPNNSPLSSTTKPAVSFAPEASARQSTIQLKTISAADYGLPPSARPPPKTIGVLPGLPDDSEIEETARRRAEAAASHRSGGILPGMTSSDLALDRSQRFSTFGRTSRKPTLALPHMNDSPYVRPPPPPVDRPVSQWPPREASPVPIKSYVVHPAAVGIVPNSRAPRTHSEPRSGKSIATAPSAKGVIPGMYADPEPPRLPTTEPASAAAPVVVWLQDSGVTDSLRIDRAHDGLLLRLRNERSFTSDPEGTLRRLLSQADKAGNGSVTEVEFVGLLVGRLGFDGYEADARGLFRRLDPKRVGSLKVGELAAGLLGKGPVFQASALGKVRELLAWRPGGVDALRTFASSIRKLDEYSTGLVARTVLRPAFERFLRSQGLDLGKVGVESVLQIFDPFNDGQVMIDDFVKGLRGSMSGDRQRLVRRAFQSIDRYRAGRVSLDEIVAAYDPAEHPQVVSGRCSSDDAVRVFVDRFGDRRGDRPISLQEFVEFYEWVSPAIDSDRCFERMITSAWHLPSAPRAGFRVLVTHGGGFQTIEEVRDTTRLNRRDVDEIKKRLRSQGLHPVAVALIDDE